MITILSQDRLTLVKCKEVYAYEAKLNNEYVWRIAGEHDVLGTYATKERAKEIINAIFEHITDFAPYSHYPKYQNYTDDASMVTGVLEYLTNVNCLTYKMPEE